MLLEDVTINSEYLYKFCVWTRAPNVVQHAFTHDKRQAGWFNGSADAECTWKKGSIDLCFTRSHLSFCSLWDLPLHVTRWELRFRDTLWGTKLWLVRALSLTWLFMRLDSVYFFAFLLGGTHLPMMMSNNACFPLFDPLGQPVTLKQRS